MSQSANDKELSGPELASAVAELCPRDLNEYAWRKASWHLRVCPVPRTAESGAQFVSDWIRADGGSLSNVYKSALLDVQVFAQHMPAGLRLCDYEYIEVALVDMERDGAPSKSKMIATWVRNLVKAGLIKKRGEVAK